MRKRVYGISYLTCPVCKHTFPISRKMTKQRANGHIKTMWCPFCKEDRQFIEDGVDKENLR